MAGDPELPKVLVVENDGGTRDALTIILRPFCEVYVATTAADAFAVLKERAIDLVTLEIKLPDRSGIEVLQEIKRTHPEVEVILITAYGTPASALAGLHHGAAGYLMKPFNVIELVRLVEQTMMQKKQTSLSDRSLASQ